MWRWVKIPKGIALLAFLLPWLTVSCSGQELISASGFDLATGNLTVHDPLGSDVRSHEASMNLWLLFAILAVLAGVAASFLSRGRGPKWVLGTSIAGLILILAGMSGLTRDSLIREAARQRGGSAGELSLPFNGADMATMVEVNWEIGYWVALVALIVSATIAWLAITGGHGARRGANIAGNLGASASAAAANAKDAAPGLAHRCLTCGQTYSADMRYCPTDGTPLA